MSKADVRSFQAVEAFRVQLIKAAESASIALQDAEQQAERVLTWLQGEQRAYWKSARRAAGEALTRAQDAYRQKALYKDASGARSSAVDELTVVRRCQSRADECDAKAKATQRHAIEVKQELQAYRGGIARLRNLLDGRVPVMVADLKDAVAMLERYASLRAEVSPAGVESRPSVARAAMETADETLADTEALRRRTPSPALRQRAQPSSLAPLWPDVPAGCRAALAERCDGDLPGKYDLITVRLPAGLSPEASHVYLERIEPTADTDTGWHAGWAADQDVDKGVQVVTITFGRLAASAPYIAGLLRLPVGTLIVARANTVLRVHNAFGNMLWEGDEQEDIQGDIQGETP